MWIRCPNCGWSTRAAFDIARGVTCVSCGRYSSLERATKLGATPQERFKKAFRFARAHRVDLSSAYSILLGIIPVSKALPIPQSYDYDPSFKDAVDRGFLTAHQASLRGDRVLYASTLALNHDMDMKTAFLITDNRMQFADAIEGAKIPGPFGRMGSTTKRKRWAAVRIVAGGAVIVLGLIVLYATREASEARTTAPATVPAFPGGAPLPVPGPDQPSSALGASAFETDSEGRVTRVSGPDPKAVLVALCAHQQFSENVTAAAVTPTVPPTPEERLGIVHDVRDLSSRRCVVIHRNLRTGLWFAGDGRNPIEFDVAP